MNSLNGATNIRNNLEVENYNGLYKHRLNFYQDAPLLEVSLEEFESWAIDRLKVLAEIEASQVRNRSFQDMRTVIQTQCKKLLNLSSNTMRSSTLDAERKKDHVSHYVLRLAFCRSEELRRRFVKAETTLFRIRFDDASTSERNAFLQSLKNSQSSRIDWEEVDSIEKESLKDLLTNSNPAIAISKSGNEFDKETYYKVLKASLSTQNPLTTSLGEVDTSTRIGRKTSRVFERRLRIRTNARSNIAYYELLFITVNASFRTKALPRLDEDSRLLPVLSHLSMSFLAGLSSEAFDPATYSSDRKISAESIDILAKKHFPMCMRNLHGNLQSNHHLKHFGRLQYSLFLKGIGLSVDEAIVFWRKSYGASISDDKFNKEYRYNIRHNYGLEGSRRAYPPRSCQKIITQDQPGPQDNHGCPFRHFSLDNLVPSLRATYGITDANDLNEITGAVKAQHFHVACTRVFEITHANKGVTKGDGLGNGESVNHPNRYFERSLQLSEDNSTEPMVVDASS
ncbi:DNA primase, large subunit [Wallemia mellicola]|uniref:DNA primase large subunit n=1 Tax=Wallemia mellicola TaxID=1708541 RepID=A0A4T0Q394_9BASI|nr:DNA primase, large subunit [Wallemia mellicola]TIC14753.1 DNA primase, large subunit [Wallemia mellicola]TIC16597.1 DNA primase, large subunit [Wallemia mellicola]TIC29767.1 DNA primase, large subunit [Wallemia mellicola]TIC68238.1 DNA primase, large subunit [Wallemia mellicola]